MNNHSFLKFIFTSLVLFFITLPCLAKIDYETKSIILNNKVIDVEIADTQEKLMMGLMHRQNLEEGKGMLFVFSQPTNTSFWMYNMEIPLDILFIKNNKIVKIYNNVPYCSYKSSQKCSTYPSEIIVDMALELPAGYCKKHNITVGQSITY